jgi:restriction system protein
MRPLLLYAQDKQEHSLREAIEQLADEFKLTDKARKEMLPSGQQATFDNRVGWARTYLKKAGLLETPRRGYFRITDLGLKAIKEAPEKIDVSFLKKYPSFIEFQQIKRDKEDETASETDVNITPEESIESAYERIRTGLASDLLSTVKSCSPSFFEKLVVDLLVKMGYGGTRKDAGRAIGRSGDDGIDGIINEDRLGLDVLYIQAKRWENVVGRPEIQKFAGALQGYRAKKGIFLTTSDFSKEAKEYVSRIDSKVILINGTNLANLMIDFNIGVSPVALYEIKRVDSDYFTED